MIAPSELILTPDKRIYHIHLLSDQVADNVILVGDPGRVDSIATFLSDIEFKEVNREFVTLTGYYKNQRLTVMSTGIGVGNIDIVLNELDALVNIDFETREQKADKKSLNLIRIGTTGALHSDIPLGSYVISEKAFGLDGMMNFHESRDAVCDLDFEAEIINSFPELTNVIHPYVVDGSEELIKNLENNKTSKGVTITAPGFYGSQGRCLRMGLAMPDFNDKLEKFSYKGFRITNYEMETSALYGYAKLLGHEAATICLAIANRPQKKALENYKEPMLGLIETVLNSLVD